jgi:hypothetical protein
VPPQYLAGQEGHLLWRLAAGLGILDLSVPLLLVCVILHADAMAQVIAFTCAYLLSARPHLPRHRVACLWGSDGLHSREQSLIDTHRKRI